MEALALDLGDNFGIRDAHSSNEKDVEEGMADDLSHNSSDVGRHSGLQVSPYNFRSASPNVGQDTPRQHLHGRPFSPAMQVADDVPPKESNRYLPYPLPRSVTNRNFGVARGTVPRFLALDGDRLENDPFPVLPTPRAQSPLSVPPSRKSSRTGTGQTWTTSLRCTLSSAFGAVKQAAGDRMNPTTRLSQKPSTGGVTPTLMNDRFTPVALRPGRHILGRRTTEEVSRLAFKPFKPNSAASVSRPPERFTVVNGDIPTGERSPFSESGSDLGKSAASEYFDTIKPHMLAAYSTGLNRHRSGVSSSSTSSTRQRRVS
ncbi:hypothetical protein FRC17_001083 [Serendipita sp. 399]|nr:hypothetical protein FRC17_001083 [Serendipita sp. 399]